MPRLFSLYSSRFSENAAPSLGLGNSAILPSLLVSDPFHKTLNAAIVDFYIHGDGELRANVHVDALVLVCLCYSFSLLHPHVVQDRCLKPKTVSGGPTSSLCA
jgi:hypothetical protein